MLLTKNRLFVAIQSGKHTFIFHMQSVFSAASTAMSRLCTAASISSSASTGGTASLLDETSPPGGASLCLLCKVIKVLLHLVPVPKFPKDQDAGTHKYNDQNDRKTVDNRFLLLRPHPLLSGLPFYAHYIIFSKALQWDETL